MFLLAVSLSAAAILERPLNLQELTDASDTLVHGEIQSLQPVLMGNRIWTLATLSVLEGTHSETVQFRIPGGCLNGLCLTIVGTPQLEEGEEVVVFLNNGQITGFVQGLFRVENGELIQDLENVSFLHQSLVLSPPSMADINQYITQITKRMHP